MLFDDSDDNDDRRYMQTIRDAVRTGRLLCIVFWKLRLMKESIFSNVYVCVTFISAPRGTPTAN